MAETTRLGTSCTKALSNQDDNYCVFNVLCVFISLVTILADLTTDILVFAEYCKNGYIFWALPTIFFILNPNILINIFSMRWCINDKKSTIRQWITHSCLVGLLERYITFLYDALSCKNLESIKMRNLLCQRNDLNLLHFLYIFTGTVPQIILQTYSIVVLNENYYTKVFALSASIASVIWGCVAYLYDVATIVSFKFTWVSFILRLTWHFGILIGRISGILLFTLIFGVWALVPLGLHWSAMTFWIVVQKTKFCSNKWEEIFYNAVMGFVYCFCYINLKEGHTRYFLMLFNGLIVTQNFGSLFLYVMIYDTEQLKRSWSIAATVCDIAGTIIGVLSMILYYRYFHPKGPIHWMTNGDIELNNKVVTDASDNLNKTNKLNFIRSFKCSKVTNEPVGSSSTVVQNLSQIETDNADKKFLLDHWIAKAGTPTFTSAPIGNSSLNASSIELFSVENTPQSLNLIRANSNNHMNDKNIKKKICSPTELTLKLSSIENLESSIDEITAITLNLQKRRGICSSDELRDDFTHLNLETCNIISKEMIKALKDHSSEVSHNTDGTNKKTSSDSIDMDLDLSFSDINSSDINTFNENIVQKLCLSALKNIKVGNQDADIENIQRIALDILKEMYTKKDKIKCGITTDFLQSKRDLDTPTEILSVHDYENICAVNIAREAWGLRSWNGYCDIENWLHDGSVIRDRSRDTLTSGSSEISSCLSQELKNAILGAPAFPKKSHTYSNVFVKVDRNNQGDYVNTVISQFNDDSYVVKPYSIDNIKDPNHLEPILEELDDLVDVDICNKKKLSSESSLVATIDEIRKATVKNSPRNLYHRREKQWDSPQLHFSKTESNFKKVMWKDTFKPNCTYNDATIGKECLPYVTSKQHQDLNEKLCNIMPSSLLEENNTNLHSSYIALTTNSRDTWNNRQDKQVHDLSNKDIDLLWQLVSDNALPINSIEHSQLSRKTPSLQYLIQKETPKNSVNSSTSKISNIKKNVKAKPRRKFSILREKFEPKTNLCSDKETLYQQSENTFHSCDPEDRNITNKLENSNFKMNADQNELKLSSHNVMPFPPTNLSHLTPKNIKEKRSMFMKQVLSPPKFNTKLRYKV